VNIRAAMASARAPDPHRGKLNNIVVSKQDPMSAKDFRSSGAVWPLSFRDRGLGSGGRPSRSGPARAVRYASLRSRQRVRIVLSGSKAAEQRPDEPLDDFLGVVAKFGAACGGSCVVIVAVVLRSV
jgi:hypothetical protein